LFSQSNLGGDKEGESAMDTSKFEDLVDYEDSLEKEKHEMEKLEAHSEERTSKLASIMNSHKKGEDLMEIDKMDESVFDMLAYDDIEGLNEADEDLDQFKIVHHKIGKFTQVLKSSVKVGDKSTQILEKATTKKKKDFQKLGLSSYSILNSFDHLQFVSLAATSGISLGDNNDTEKEVLDIMMAKEKSQAILTKARIKKEEERLKNK
jgi:hypothetical protein